MPILWHADTNETQTSSVVSHVGGVPRLPSDLPLPKVPQSEDVMSFFFSLDLGFHPGHRNKVLSVFASTTTFDENDCIPQMFGTNTSGYDIPIGALDSYQRHFRIFVTPASGAILRDDYTTRIRFNVLHEAEALPQGAVRFGERRAQPQWVLNDESPGTYGGVDRFDFLFQTQEDYRFRLSTGAPRQMLPDFTGPAGALAPSLVDLYDLWARNAAYFFITSGDKVLVVPQSD
jgi:hypothetical protein